jgi:hypothetical protein
MKKNKKKGNRTEEKNWTKRWEKKKGHELKRTDKNMKSSIRRMGRKELEVHIYRCHRKMKPGKMLPTYTLGILVQLPAKHAPKARC